MTLQTIPLADVAKFDETTDVLVIGLGAAGVSAAIEAHIQ
jgi:heterodisulfide reductase subunit A-like polyferredoxin